MVQKKIETGNHKILSNIHENPFEKVLINSLKKPPSDNTRSETISSILSGLNKTIVKKGEIKIEPHHFHSYFEDILRKRKVNYEDLFSNAFRKHFGDEFGRFKDFKKTRGEKPRKPTRQKPVPEVRVEVVEETPVEELGTIASEEPTLFHVTEEQMRSMPIHALAEVPRTATVDVKRRGILNALKVYHPDKHMGKSKATRDKAHEIAKVLVDKLNELSGK